MKNHFKIEGPAVISFSGGRTSGYMLWRILQAHQWILPDDVKVVFANTGKEMPETLDFVRDCGVHWNVPIHWVEYRAKTDDGKQIAMVNYETASRKGEPFAALIDDRRYLPNPVARMCTAELKIRVMHRFIKSVFGYDEWTTCIGMRADEQRRVAKLANSSEGKYETRIAPLAIAGLTVADVGEFWSRQIFDLKLPNMNGRTMHGNCDLCFLKGAKQIYALIREEPTRAIWWMEQEKKIEVSGAFEKATMATFRADRPSYKAMYKMAANQAEMFDFDEPLQDCACTD
jgi:3'-phosphoadenosine 5'-phosphosulfate sulfotransferase (PAPS reductase)/FAD synthetase